MKKLALLAALMAGGALGAEEPLKLTGSFGLGFDTIPGASATTGLLPGISQPNAATFRYWINEKFAWEGDLALSVNSQPGAAPAGGMTTTMGWGLGTTLKYNAVRPTELVLVQWLGGLSIAQLGQKTQGDATAGTPDAGQTTTAFNLFVGGGFEAFLPVWRSLSLEGSLRLRVSTIQTKTEGSAQVGASSSFLGIESQGFTPLNLAVHYYF